MRYLLMMFAAVLVSGCLQTEAQELIHVPDKCQCSTTLSRIDSLLINLEKVDATPVVDDLIEFPEVKPIESDVKPPVQESPRSQALIYIDEDGSCIYCERLKRDLKSEVDGVKGWSVGDHPSADFRFLPANADQRERGLPLIVYVTNGVTTGIHRGYKREDLNEIVNNHPLGTKPTKKANVAPPQVVYTRPPVVGSVVQWGSSSCAYSSASCSQPMQFNNQSCDTYSSTCQPVMSQPFYTAPPPLRAQRTLRCNPITGLCY